MHRLASQFGGRKQDDLMNRSWDPIQVDDFFFLDRNMRQLH